VKRFWKAAEVEREGEVWGIKLDGKPLRTPARAALVVPAEALARAIAEEWADSGDEVDPHAMPLTGLANAAIDRAAPDRQAFAAGLARYAEADLFCYGAEGPGPLVERQAQSWDPLLAWARRRYDVDFAITSGLVHVAQPTATVERLAHAVAALDAFHLAALSPLVTIGGSLIAALAVLEKSIPVAQVWDAVSLDERWQLEQWGVDPEAQTALENRKRDYLAAARFLELLEG
jgi:chaperone required for assembly of F1-ATPase